MKLAFPVATPEVQSSILGAKGPIETTLRDLREAGYDAIEPFVADPSRFDTAAWGRAVTASGLTVVAIGTGPLVFDHGLTFTSHDPAVRQTAIARTCSVIDFAAALSTQVNIGKLRGDLGTDPNHPTRSWQREALEKVAAHAARQGVVLTLEPQHRGIIDNLNTTPDALAWLASEAPAGFQLMLDVFHMHSEQEDVSAGIRTALSRGVLSHLHFAGARRDTPSAVDPIAFGPIVAQLRHGGYNRAITVEIKPAPDWLAAARSAASFLVPLLHTP